MKILVVDDSQFAQQVMKKMLLEQIPDAEIYFACTGEQGYDMYRSVSPDFIITDLLMPGVDGKTLIKLIRYSNQEVKIIVISSDVQKSIKSEVEEYGITLFINKPLDKEKQLQLVKILKEV